MNERLSDVHPILCLHPLLSPPRRMVTDGSLITVIDPTSYLLHGVERVISPGSARPLAFHRRLLLTIGPVTPLFSPAVRVPPIVPPTAMTMKFISAQYPDVVSSERFEHVNTYTEMAGGGISRSFACFFYRTVAGPELRGVGRRFFVLENPAR